MVQDARRLLNASALVEMQFAPVGVAVFESKRNALGRSGPAAADFVAAVLETVGQKDANAMFLAGDGIEDRLAAAGEDAFGGAASAARRHIDVDGDRGVDGIMDLLAHGGEDSPEGGHRLGVLAGEDAE